MQGAESGGGALLDIPEFTLEESRRGGGVEGRRGAPNASAGTKAGPSTSSHKRKKHRANSEASFDDEAEM